ncbi:hypothetical protein [Hymenobacter convexus]|uniref:hypothetical protein n=1 Tax=Hymenobacter sp. CA1UV-4 TaxID=3063782 RepID=UPI002713D6E1|nr:hypothetical protein [Hymenobacter sp. CA1UV-4]MDO7851824.1 hypothetical protein [Hymenobacter sp. CA1UV-4]
MPKLIDYPRTSYAGAWELAEVVDDTGGKCEIETAARKLNRKVSGSFKAIIGSAVKFGLLTSKRELLSVTTLYKRIKHAYDKKEELLFHREAFLTPPLFSQICRKFRLRELPVQMLDVMLIREFGVEEINAQGVAKAFVEGCRMVNLLDERNTMADIDASAGQLQPRRELSTPVLAQTSFSPSQPANNENSRPALEDESPNGTPRNSGVFGQVDPEAQPTGQRPVSDAVANLFGLFNSNAEENLLVHPVATSNVDIEEKTPAPIQVENSIEADYPVREPDSTPKPPAFASNTTFSFELKISGPGLNSILSIVEEEDILIAQALLEKVRRQLRNKEH